MLSILSTKLSGFHVSVQNGIETVYVWCLCVVCVVCVCVWHVYAVGMVCAWMSVFVCGVYVCACVRVCAHVWCVCVVCV